MNARRPDLGQLTPEQKDALIGDLRRELAAAQSEARLLKRRLGMAPPAGRASESALLGRLREWRQGIAAAQGVPAYVVFTDATMSALAERQPRAVEQLVDIAGIGPRKVGLYGAAVVALVGGARPADLLVAAGVDGSLAGSRKSSATA